MPILASDDAMSAGAATGGMGNVRPGDIKIRLRANKRQSVTKTINTIESDFPSNSEQITFCITKLTKLQTDLCTLDSEVENFMLLNQLWSDSDLECQTEIADQYQDRISLILIRLNTALTSLSRPVVNSGPAASVLKPKLKLPDIELPFFDNNPENYSKFINDLEQILDKFEFTEFERFTYLKKQVSGAAREIVESVPLGDMKYTDAKKLLFDAFADKTVQQFSVIQKFLSLKSLSDNNLYSWISEIRVLTDQMTRLDITSDIFAQYFIWNSLSDNYRQHFISVINKTKPSLQDIKDHAFEVINRIKDARSFGNAVIPNNSISLATNITYENSGKINAKIDHSSCWLCQKAGLSDYYKHKIYKCPEFKSAKQKKDKIVELNGCTRCGYLNHTVNNCKFKFAGKCKNCKKYHAYFLCTAQSTNDSSSSSNSNDVRVSSSVITIANNSISSSAGMIVPTFTADFKSKKKSVKARVLYDPASQFSFVSEESIKKLPHKILQNNIKLNVSGFNSSKEFSAKIVELVATVSGRNLKFGAIVAPKINASISSKHFPEICSLFESNKLNLADRNLGDDGVVDILLGLNGSADFPVASFPVAGSNRCAQIYSSPAGIMLAGDMSHLLEKPDFSALNKFLSMINHVE